MVPHYGDVTVMRPLVINVPDPPDGALPSSCPYCGRPCWLTRLEQTLSGLPPVVTYTSACTWCAISRTRQQRVMDQARWVKENAEVCEATAG